MLRFLLIMVHSSVLVLLDVRSRRSALWAGNGLWAGVNVVQFSSYFLVEGFQVAPLSAKLLLQYTISMMSWGLTGEGGVCHSSFIVLVLFHFSRRIVPIRILL